MNEMTMEQYMHITGATPALGRRVYKDTAERIKTILLYYVHRPLLDYLRVASRTTLILKFDLDYFFRRGFWIIFLMFSFLNCDHYLLAL